MLKLDITGIIFALENKHKIDRIFWKTRKTYFTPVDAIDSILPHCNPPSF